MSYPGISSILRSHGLPRLSQLLLAWSLVCLGSPGGAQAGTWGSLSDPFQAGVSQYFGVTASGVPVDGTHTLYTVPTPTGSNADDYWQPWFDVSNNNLMAEFDARGLVEYPFVYGPLAGYGQGADGTQSLYGEFDFITGGQWTFQIDDGLHTSAKLSSLSGTSVGIVDGTFFKWTYAYQSLGIELIPFAPESAPRAAAQPRALIMLVRITNRGSTTVNGHLSVPGGMKDADQLDSTLKPATLYGSAATPIPANHKTDTRNFIPRFAEVGPAVAGYEAVMPLESTAWSPALPTVSFTLAAGASRILEFAFMVGGGVPELQHTRDLVRQKSVLTWLNETRTSHTVRRGVLSIPDQTYVSELFERYVEAAHTSYLYSGSGKLRSPHGGSYLLMGMLAPEYVSGAIPGGNLGLTCPIQDVSYSLYQFTAASVLANEYYLWGGDPAFFQNSSSFKTQTKCLINAILSTKYPNVTLFPSDYIWDGPSRGDYHTGSNLLVWYVLTVASRIAAEVWNDASSASSWAASADEIKASLTAHDVIQGYYGDQFAEGTWIDGTVDDTARCHDGEEIAVLSAPILGFAEPDDPLITHHGKAAMSSQNIFYEPAVEGMYWGDGAPVTAPGWLTLLSGATTETGLLSAFDRFRAVTDVDGSLYWWPYDYPSDAPEDIRRRVSYASGTPIDTAKVDYATSNFNALLIHNVLGLSADLPKKTVSFKPVAPWSSFQWTGGRIGNAFFDLEYSDSGSAITARLTNRNSTAYQATIELVVPTGKIASGVTPTGTRYGRDSLRLADVSLQANQSISLTLPYAPYPTSTCVSTNWEASMDAHDLNPSGSWDADSAADADGNGLAEGYEWRLLSIARCSTPAVESTYQANRNRCLSLGWGDWWGTICADYATVSQALADVVNQWCTPKQSFTPYRVNGVEPLASTGDLDGDSLTNLDEYLLLGGATTSMERYADAASTPHVSGPPVTLYPSGYELSKGTYASGTLPTSVSSDDNTYFVTRSETRGTTRYSTTDYTVLVTAKTATRIGVSASLKSSVSGTGVTIYLYNRNTAAWEMQQSASVSTAESMITFTVASSASRYVTPTDGSLKVRVEASKKLTSFSLSLELLSLTVTP